jgi:serine/threonine-protein kinase
MNPERWARLESLLDSAFELDPEERIAFLAQACGDDSELRCEAEALLLAEAAAPAFLNGEAAQFASPALDDLSGDDPPEPGITAAVRADSQ